MNEKYDSKKNSSESGSYTLSLNQHKVGKFLIFLM